MTGRFLRGPTRLGRFRHLALGLMGWGLFVLGARAAGPLLESPGPGLVAGVLLLIAAVLGNGLWQLTLDVWRLHELRLSVLHAGWFLVLQAIVVMLNQTDDPAFLVAAGLLGLGKAVLVLWPEDPRRPPEPFWSILRTGGARRAG